MVLNTTVVAGFTILEILVVGGIVLGGSGVYFFLQNKEAQRKFNEVLDSLVNTAGMSKDKPYSEEEMREKVRSALENDKQEMDEVQKEMTIDHVFSEIEAIYSEAKQLGREEERMKGEDSDSVYNLLIIVAAGQFGTFAILLWQFVI